MNELGAGDRLDHSTAMLSGGQQQRVAVARALANHLSLILADEPTAALDSHRGRQVMELFRNVAREHGIGSFVLTRPRVPLLGGGEIPSIFFGTASIILVVASSR